MRNRHIFGYVLLAVLGVIFLAGGILCQEKLGRLAFLKPFAGAAIAMFSPVPIGLFLGFLLGFSDEDKEKTVLAKIVKSGLVLLTGASLASIGRIFEVISKEIPIIAQELCLSSSMVKFLCPTLFFPAIFLGYYLWSQYRQQLQRFTDALLNYLTNSFLREVDYPKEIYGRILEFSEEQQPSGKDEIDKVYFAKGVAKMKLEQEGAYEELLRIKDVEAFGEGVHKILAQAAMQADKLEEAKEYCKRYLEKHEADTEAGELLLKVMKKIYNTTKSNEEKKNITNDARKFANAMMGKETLEKSNINKIWLGLVEEAVND